MRPYASLTEKGELTMVDLDVNLPSGGHALLLRCNPKDVDAIEKAIRKHGMTGYMHSSSLDFPREYGVRVDPHFRIRAAFERVAEDGYRDRAREIVAGVLKNGEAGYEKSVAKLVEWMRETFKAEED